MYVLHSLIPKEGGHFLPGPLVLAVTVKTDPGDDNLAVFQLTKKTPNMLCESILKMLQYSKFIVTSLAYI